ncbi:MAG TPA: LysM peptidoglycan-binding domain-containing protein [Candidatus Baltobacteraceae bacterium]|jgi:cell division protein FtsB|nr:LysM peptidoglycan-binding domain-containing protein [Candidatus Baltobacteraceae bacterium]
MKRFFVLIGISFFALAATAQDGAPASTPAAEAAAKQGADERYERMAADIQALQSANDALQAKLTAIEQQVQDLRSQQSQSAASVSTPDDLKRLADKIQEVDRKREEDKEAIAEEIRRSIAELKHAVADSPPPSRVSSSKPAPGADSTDTDKGFVYKIQDGDSLSAIVKAYNADFKSKGMKTISLQQAMDANPNVDWNRLRVGQRIIIPRPPAQ